eukprot:m51a1_g3844 hypothetical protein (142) ;mRNA; r:361153-362259
MREVDRETLQLQDLLRFEQGLRVSTNAASRKHLQYTVFFQLTLVVIIGCCVAIVINLVRLPLLQWRVIEFVPVVIALSGLVALLRTDVREPVREHFARINRVLRYFNVYFEPDRMKLFALQQLDPGTEGADDAGYLSLITS